MNRFALLTFYRSLVRHKFYAALNIGGLAVGIAVFLVLGLYVRFETSYEHWLPGYRHVYQVESKQPDEISNRPSQNTPVAVWTAVSRDLPNTVGTRVRGQAATILKDGIGIRETIALVDPGFTSIFDLPVLEGNLRGAFADPTALAITQRTATKYFGALNPVGKTMTVTYAGRQHAYHIAAVIENLPNNTDLSFDLVARFVFSNDPNDTTYKETHYWNYDDVQTYVREADSGAAYQFNDELTALEQRHAQNETPDNPGFSVRLSMQPLTDVHFETAGAQLAMTTLGIVGALTLLIAIVNYVNLATARAGLRAREVAMRKVLGADRRTLARHYIGEAVATSAISGFIGLVLAECGLPLVNAAGGLSLSIVYLGLNGVLLPLTMLVLLVGIVAGFYPALVLSRFPAASVLASARSPGGGRWGTRVREGLVVLQFTIAIAFMIGTLVLVAQTRHVRAADLGFDRSSLLIVRSFGSDSLTDPRRDAIVHRFRDLPGVSAVAVGNNAPGGGLFTAETSIALPGVPGNGPSFRFFETTPGYFDAVGAHLIAGRLFDATRAADINANIADLKGSGEIPANIVINRTGAAMLHFASPEQAIGRTVGGKNPRTIIGVVEDMRFDTPRVPIPPTMYDFQITQPASPIAILRFTGDPKSMLDAAQQTWRREAPEVPFQAKTATQALDDFYARDDHSASLFTIGAVLAVAIGCVGLWGLASFNTARRIKEIGIRKTLGASSTDVVKLLVGQFLRPVLIANLFAWPLAFLAMRTWLAGFDDRIALSPLFFIAATVLALAIAVLTVLAQSLRAARSTPAWALRHE